MESFSSEAKAIRRIERSEAAGHGAQCRRSRYQELRSIDPSRVISYGMQAAADVYPVRHEFGWEVTDAMFDTPIGKIEVRTGDG
jgi:hypothetical protein